MIHKVDERIGKKFGRLTILEILCPIFCIARCECGVTKKFRTGHLKSGGTTSCGCKVTEMLLKRNTSHGLRFHPLNSVWKTMKARCYNKNVPSFKYYGAKGIQMCKEWETDFKIFYDWCMSNGWKKRMNIDRFPNRHGNYSPENCRITTPKKNMNNRDDNRILAVRGENLTMSETAERFGLNYNTLQSRLRYGWSIEKSISTPIS